MSVASYLQALPRQEKLELERIRRLILALIPEAEERLSRGVPFFYYRGKRAVGFHSTQTHLSFYIMEGQVLKNLRSQLRGFDSSSTVIKFTLENPLPDALIKKLVLARIKEIDEAASGVQVFRIGQLSKLALDYAFQDAVGMESAMGFLSQPAVW